MSIPQHVTKDVGGVISYYAPSRPSTATVTVKTATGAEKVSAQAATIDSVDTTISTSASRNGRSIEVTDATGIIVGGEYDLSAPTERVRVREISGTTIYLYTPLLQPHASGSALQGTRISYSMSAAECDELWADGRAEWSLDGSLTDIGAVECTKYPVRRLASEQDLFREHPRINQLMGDTVDSGALLDDAFEMVLSDIGKRGRMYLMTGGPEFVNATRKAAMLLILDDRGSEEAEILYQRKLRQYHDELARLMAMVPQDTDQDGIIEQHEQASLRSFEIHRAS